MQLDPLPVARLLLYFSSTFCFTATVLLLYLSSRFTPPSAAYISGFLQRTSTLLLF
jgi:hypothetical protein